MVVESVSRTGIVVRPSLTNSQLLDRVGSWATDDLSASSNTNIPSTLLQGHCLPSLGQSAGASHQQLFAAVNASSQHSPPSQRTHSSTSEAAIDALLTQIARVAENSTGEEEEARSYEVEAEADEDDGDERDFFGQSFEME